MTAKALSQTLAQHGIEHTCYESPCPDVEDDLVTVSKSLYVQVNPLTGTAYLVEEAEHGRFRLSGPFDTLQQVMTDLLHIL